MTRQATSSKTYSWTGNEIVAVLLGGPSAEREVSLRSGKAVAEAFRQRGNQVVLVDPKDRILEIPSSVDAAFLALHGEFGEDGEVQALLEADGIPYTGCNSEISRIAIDKVLSKERFDDERVPTPKWTQAESPEAAFPEFLKLPLIVKPTCQGSTIGLEIVKERSQWGAALERAFEHGPVQLVEEMVDARELTVGILSDRALPVVEIRPNEGIYDYKNKYTKGACRYFCPAELTQDETEIVQDAAFRAFKSVGGGPYSRVDVMLAGDGTPYVLEVNTLPGMTETSLLPMAAAEVGMSFSDLCVHLAESAMTRAGRMTE